MDLEDIAPRFAATLEDGQDSERVDVATCIQLNELQQDLIRELLNIIDDEKTITERSKDLCIDEIRRLQDGQTTTRWNKVLLSSFIPYFSSRSFDASRARTTHTINEPKRYVHDAQLNVDGEYETALDTYHHNTSATAWNLGERHELVRGVLREVRSLLERPLLRQLNSAVEELNRLRKAKHSGTRRNFNASESGFAVDVDDNVSESALTHNSAHAAMGMLEAEMRVSTLRRRLDDLRRLDDTSVFARACTELGGADALDESIDWLRVACMTLRGRYSDIDCKLVWTNQMSLRLRNDAAWTAEEDARLVELADRYGNANWPAIARELKSSRSAFECLRRYQQVHNTDSSLRSATWSLVEDNRLVEEIEHALSERGVFGNFQDWPRAVWRAVSMQLEARSEVECHSRFLALAAEANSAPSHTTLIISQEESERRAALLARVSRLTVVNENANSNDTVKPKKRKTVKERRWPLFRRKWTPAEEETLVNAVEKLGSKGNWERVAARLPGRTAAQCREHFLAIERANEMKTRCWTYEDDRRLLQFLTSLAVEKEDGSEQFPKSNRMKFQWNEMAIELKRNVHTVLRRADGLRLLVEKCSILEHDTDADADDAESVDLHKVLMQPANGKVRGYKLEWSVAYRCWKQYIRDPVEFGGQFVPHPIVGEAIRTLRNRQLRSDHEIEQLVEHACLAVASKCASRTWIRPQQEETSAATSGSSFSAPGSIGQRLHMWVTDDDFLAMKADADVHGDFLQRPALYAPDSWQIRRFLQLARGMLVLHSRVTTNWINSRNLRLKFCPRNTRPDWATSLSVREMISLSKKNLQSRSAVVPARLRRTIAPSLSGGKAAAGSSATVSSQRIARKRTERPVRGRTRSNARISSKSLIPNVPQVRALSSTKLAAAPRAAFQPEQPSYEDSSAMMQIDDASSDGRVQPNEAAFLRAALNVGVALSNARVRWDSRFVVDHTVLLPPNPVCFNTMQRLRYLLLEAAEANQDRPEEEAVEGRERGRATDGSVTSSAENTQAYKRLLERCMLLFGWCAVLAQTGQTELLQNVSAAPMLDQTAASDSLSASAPTPQSQSRTNRIIVVTAASPAECEQAKASEQVARASNTPPKCSTLQAKIVDVRQVAAEPRRAESQVETAATSGASQSSSSAQAKFSSRGRRLSEPYLQLLAADGDESDPEWHDEELERPRRRGKKRRRKQKKVSKKAAKKRLMSNQDSNSNTKQAAGGRGNVTDQSGPAAVAQDELKLGVIRLDNSIELRYDPQHLLRILTNAMSVTQAV